MKRPTTIGPDGRAPNVTPPHTTKPQTKEKEISVTEIPTEQLINEIDVHDLQILEIDKCEYIFYKKSPSSNKGYGFMAHKGNCKNTIHYYSRSKKIMIELRSIKAIINDYKINR